MPWPTHVIFLQFPVLCRWDNKKNHWTKSNIHRVSYDKENSIIRFRTAVFGTFAFATPRYINLPFRNWRIQPEKDESVTVKIMSVVLRLNFNIKGNLICLSLVENNPAKALQDITGKYFKLNRLKRYMKEAGVDIFPGMYYLYPYTTLYGKWSITENWDCAEMLNECFLRRRPSRTSSKQFSFNGF